MATYSNSPEDFLRVIKGSSDTAAVMSGAMSYLMASNPEIARRISMLPSDARSQALSAYATKIRSGGSVEDASAELQKALPQAQSSSPFGYLADGTRADKPQLNPQVEKYLDWEAQTPEGNAAREERMGEVSKLIGLAVPVPGAGLINSAANIIRGESIGSQMPDLGKVFGTPAAYSDYQYRQEAADRGVNVAAGQQAVNDYSSSLSSLADAGRQATQQQTAAPQASEAAASESESGGAEGATRAFANQVGYNPNGFNTPSSDDGNGGSDGYAKGGKVTKAKLSGPNPKGKDDGYAALDAGEFVVKASIAKKLGSAKLRALNEGRAGIVMKAMNK